MTIETTAVACALRAIMAHRVSTVVVNTVGNLSAVNIPAGSFGVVSTGNLNAMDILVGSLNAMDIRAGSSAAANIPAVYSPDLNPIEQLFAKLKALLRKIASYTLKNTAFTVRSL